MSVFSPVYGNLSHCVGRSVGRSVGWSVRETTERERPTVDMKDGGEDLRFSSSAAA